MEIEKLSAESTKDFIALIEIFNEVFENEDKTLNEDYLRKLLSIPDFLVFVVTDHGKVIGGLTIYVLQQYYDEKSIAYIYDVGISPSYQGQGVGQALMSYTCEYCKKNGLSEAYVEAEFEDDEAVKFYRKTTYSSELQAIHFTYSFSESEKGE